jgi:hypothetical protein
LPARALLYEDYILFLILKTGKLQEGERAVDRKRGEDGGVFSKKKMKIQMKK